jgi:hypothetical protein
MYINYKTYIFSTAIGPHVCHSLNLTKKKKKQTMQYQIIKFLLVSCGNGFFLHKRLLFIYYF